MTISAYSAAQPYAPVAPINPPSGGADAGAVETGDSAPPSTGAATHRGSSQQFSNSLVIALLNAQEQFYMQGPAPSSGPVGPAGSNGPNGLSLHAPPEIDGDTRIQSTAYISSGGVPGGLDLDSLDAADAAKELVDTAGANGQLSFSDVEKVLGGLGQDDSKYSVRAAVTRDWDKLTHGRGVISAQDLTTALQGIIDTRSES